MIELDKSELATIIQGFEEQMEQLTKITKRKEFLRMHQKIFNSAQQLKKALENGPISKEQMKQYAKEYQRLMKQFKELCQLGEEIESKI